MQAYNVNDFVAHVSANSDRAYIILSIDPSCDDTIRLIEVMAPLIGAGATHMVGAYCGAILSFATLVEAHSTIISLERALPQLCGYGVIAVVYVAGHPFMTLREPNVEDPEIAFAQSSTMM